MATPKKLPSGRWRTLVYIGEKDGKRQYKSFTADTRRESAFLAAHYIAESEEKKEKGLTISEAVEAYISSRTAVSSPTTIKNYKSIRKHHLDEIGQIYATDATVGDIQKWVNDLSMSHSPKTVRNIANLILAALVSQGNHIRVTFPQKKPVTYHIPTDDDIKRLLDLSDGDLKKAIYLAAFGTLRRGEVCAVKYGDIRGESIYIHADLVKDEYNRWIYKDIPKTSESVRTVIYPKKIIRMLGKGSPEEYVISSNPDSITHKFEKIRQKCGLKCRFHDLRHYAASVMHYLGIPDQYIMERGGWKSDAVLKSVYRHALSDQTKKFSDVTNEYLADKFF